ncbi:MAG: hypothetical protein EOP04_23315 [Proteobacteria bacterium]|nr:MAG: hypothetical protein EOP04_23315 [Pseudomonadota bacterium]
MYREEQTNHDFGYICLFRSIERHWIYQDEKKLKWWIDILLQVNYTDRKVLIAGVLFDCKRGESLNSLQTWAKRWRTDVSTVRRFLLLLQKDGMIHYKSETKTIRITVCNYDSYNGQRNDDATKVKRRRNAGETLAAPNNNDKNDNNDESEAAASQTALAIVFSEEQKTSFVKFQAWLATNCPSVAKMKEPFTIDQFIRLKNKLDWKKIADICEQMESWEKLNTKRINAYKTFCAFYKREQNGSAAA